jgi:hypothetical protein
MRLLTPLAPVALLCCSIVLPGQEPNAGPSAPPRAAVQSPPTQAPATTATPFTTERILEQLAGTYKDVSRVADALPSNVRARENITCARPGGVDLQLHMYQSRGSGPSPAVLVAHGEGWESGSRQMARQLKAAPPASVEWALDNLTSVGGHTVTVIGAPSVVSTPAGQAIEFNGTSDGVLVEANPLEGLTQFTIEVLFATAPDGSAEQRFVHVQETSGDNRALIELRLLEGGRWCLDTFLKHGSAARTLIDRERTHAPTTWHVASLVFDGREMSHYVDGERELSGDVAFQPMGPGRTSIGVRMNRVSWFKGRIARLRVTPSPLTPAEMMRAPRA